MKMFNLQVLRNRAREVFVHKIGEILEDRETYSVVYATVNRDKAVRHFLMEKISQLHCG